MPSPERMAVDREADRQFVIFVGSIVAAVGITIASFVIAACR